MAIYTQECVYLIVTTNAMTTRHEQENKLKQTFGLDRFYDDQWETIDRILKGERVLLIEKTGFGKSLTQADICL